MSELISKSEERNTATGRTAPITGRNSSVNGARRVAPRAGQNAQSVGVRDTAPLSLPRGGMTAQSTPRQSADTARPYAPMASGSARRPRSIASEAAAGGNTGTLRNTGTRSTNTAPAAKAYGAGVAVRPTASRAKSTAFVFPFRASIAGIARHRSAVNTKAVLKIALAVAAAVCLFVGLPLAVKLSRGKNSDPMRADTVLGAVLSAEGTGDGKGAQNADSIDVTAAADSAEDESSAPRYTVKFSFYQKPEIICTTNGRTVGELAELLGIELGSGEQMKVDTAVLVDSDTDISVDTVTHGTASAQVSIDYETKYIDTDTVPRGSTRVQQQGVEGIRTVTYDVTYVNGVETDRKETGSYVSRQPTDRIIARGTGGTVTLGGAPYSYSYCLVCDSTVYTGGGITASGLPATEQVIAVDPRVIPLGTRVYIEGIGYRIAADTGGLIKGNFIDIYYEESNPNFAGYGRRNVKVYILD